LLGQKSNAHLNISCVKVSIEILAVENVHLSVQICAFAVQRNVVVEELRATHLLCSILQTAQTEITQIEK
jgi:hypothetical protein